MRPRSALFAVGVAVVIGAEAYVVFARNDSALAIEGRQQYEVSEFAARQPVQHAFLMRGDGLHQVQVQFHSNRRAAARVQWILWDGSPELGRIPRAFEGTDTFDLRPGRQWHSFNFFRNGTSNDRWYTIELRLLDVDPENLAKVSVVASRDNPDRGGVLWVNGVRQTGSLVMRAARQGRSIYRRFLVEAAPNLPPPLQLPAVQWLIVIVVHAAFVVFAWAVMTEATATGAAHHEV